MKSIVSRFLSIFLLTILLVTACNNPKNTPLQSEPLRVGYNLWPGTFPVAIAQEKGFFTQQGVNVETSYTVNYLKSVSDFVSGQSDGIFIVLGSLIGLVEKIPDVQMVLASDESAGADVVLAVPTIKKVADLKGKRIGVKLGDYGELFVTKFLEQNGLNTNEVSLVNVEGEAIPAHFKSGDIQAGQTWEPYVTEAIKGKARVLFTSEQTPGLMPSVLVFRSKIIRDRPDEVKAFIKAWFQAQDYWKANPEESKIAIAKVLNIKPNEISTEGIKLYTLQDNLKAFTPGSTTESLYHTSKLYADFSIRTGGLSAAPDIKKMINPYFLQQLQKVN
ncbi:ABC transporter substrate-binding protein [Microcoleus sp. FACHB-831]|uniref:ABC transporter substrate-binding protein n=1 Tax=Microcoleus sp. FACHB-831 TaxID=2692827 RepID=UPI001683F765|nr:ABC transporter substrate-binding protein [Microcoleus sp. FACHB-831]MBD1923899.1 ABC transporter substrate-binding protein [Microcoleus sp. FACHB-831]